MVGAWRTVRAELKAYGGTLARKKEILALNKTDAMTGRISRPSAPCSPRRAGARCGDLGVSGRGVPELLHELGRLVDRQRDQLEDAA